MIFVDFGLACIVSFPVPSKRFARQLRLKKLVKSHYRHRRDESADTCSSVTTMEEEDSEQKKAWHQRLFKSASGVLSRRDSDSSNSEHSRQCVVDHTKDSGGGSRGLEVEGKGCIDLEDDTHETSADGGNITPHNLNNPNNNVALLHSHILIALSLMLVLHGMVW